MRFEFVCIFCTYRTCTLFIKDNLKLMQHVMALSVQNKFIFSIDVTFFMVATWTSAIACTLFDTKVDVLLWCQIKYRLLDTKVLVPCPCALLNFWGRAVLFYIWVTHLWSSQENQGFYPTWDRLPQPQWTSIWNWHEIHITLLKQLVQWLSLPKAKIRL